MTTTFAEADKVFASRHHLPLGMDFAGAANYGYLVSDLGVVNAQMLAINRTIHDIAPGKPYPLSRAHLLALYPTRLSIGSDLRHLRRSLPIGNDALEPGTKLTLDPLTTPPMVLGIVDAVTKSGLFLWLKHWKNPANTENFILGIAQTSSGNGTDSLEVFVICQWGTRCHTIAHLIRLSKLQDFIPQLWLMLASCFKRVVRYVVSLPEATVQPPLPNRLTRRTIAQLELRFRNQLYAASWAQAIAKKLAVLCVILLVGLLSYSAPSSLRAHATATPQHQQSHGLLTSQIASIENQLAIESPSVFRDYNAQGLTPLEQQMVNSRAFTNKATSMEEYAGDPPETSLGVLVGMPFRELYLLANLFGIVLLAGLILLGVGVEKLATFLCELARARRHHEQI